MSVITDGGRHYTPPYKSRETNINIKDNDLLRGYIKVIYDGYGTFIKLDDNTGENYSLTFHPEGGYLIPDNDCMVAFKAIGKDGHGIDASGVIVDSLENRVADFITLHGGMGKTSFRPAAGQIYTAINNDGRRFTLPLPNETASSIHIDRIGNDTIIIDLLGKVPQKGQVVVQQRGIVLWSTQINDNYSFKFSPKKALSGIMQILLLDKDMNRWSERLVFIDNEKVAHADITTDKKSYGNRKIVWCTADIDTLALKKGGNFAISVTDRHSAIIDSMHSIKTQLLLASDLKGYIENPGFYFSSADSSFRSEALDNLILTQGWRRYNIPAVLKGHKLSPEFPIEKSMAVSGTVKSRWRGKPLKGISLAMISPSTGYGNLTESDKDGRFEFDGFEFPDDAVYYIQAVNTKGGFEDNIVLDNPDFPDISYLTAEPQPKAAEHLMDNRLRAELNPELRSILLSEVIVSAQKMKRYNTWYETIARSNFDPEAPENFIIATLEEAIRSLHGVNIDSHGNIVHRGGIVGVFIDGFPLITSENSSAGDIIPGAPDARIKRHTHKGTIIGMDASTTASWNFPMASSTSRMLDEIEVMCPYSNIASISFLNSAEAVVLGRNAINGALMIRTKDGNGLNGINEHNPHIAIAKPLGYQRPAEFYSPKYEPTERPDGTDLRSTVYWNPCVRIGDDGKADFEFFTSDNPSTSYTMLIEGISDDGRIITGNASIKIE